MDLFTASGSGDLETVTNLLNQGSDPNLGDTWTGRGNMWYTSMYLYIN